MADIVQRIGFETAGAVSALNSLTSATNRFNSSLRSLNKNVAASNFGKAAASLQKVNTSAKAAAGGMSTLNTNMTAAGKAGVSAGEKLTISWGTFARVILTQGIVRAINAISQAVSEAAKSANEFEVATARIANITAEGQGGVDGLRNAIAQLAVVTGRPIAEVTEASMEALQNNLGSTKETMELLSGSADDLAKITGSTLTQSINSISSVLKAFNRPISDSADIADTFFVAIDKGRISLQEMESRLGTILPQSNALGVSFEEAAAAAASLTLSGLNTSTALTQIRNIQAKLIKPTEDLEKAFAKLGVRSGQELVKKFGGLSGALRALQQSFNGNEKEVAKAFGTIRGQLGVLNLLANEGSNFSDVLDAIGERSGRAAEAAEAVNKTKFNLINQQAELLNKSLRVVGEEVNTLKLGAIVFANEFVAGLGIIRDKLQPVIDRLQNLINIYNKFTNPGSFTAASRIDEIKAAAARAKSELALANTQADQLAKGRATDIINGTNSGSDERAKANAINQELTRREKINNKLNSQIEFARNQLEANLRTQKEFAALAERGGAPSLFGDPAKLAASRAQVEAINTKLAELSERARTATGAQLVQVEKELSLQQEKISLLAQSDSLDQKQKQGLQGQVEAVDQQVKGQAKINELESKRTNSDAGIAQGKKILNKIIDDQVFKIGTDLPNASNKAKTSIESVPDPQVNAAPAISQMNALTAAANRAAAAVARANSGGGGGGNAYHGGTPAYRAAGGGVRGGDTVPAMLSPGEMVVNARQTRKNFAQLQAINAGQSPQFRESGGSVTNVGDINVNVAGGSGSENPDAVGRAIGNSLRREIRRNNLAL